MITDKLLKDGWEKVNLTENNTQIGDNICSLNGMFATLMSITPKGLYSVSYDADYAGEPRTYFTPERFEQSFLVDKRK